MFINLAQQEITLKIVYYGPGLSGKTTNLQYIYDHINPSLRSDLITLKTREERTLFFDFLQLEFGKVLGKKPRFNLYTVPGQVYYRHSRKVILSGVDGLVFVADSQLGRMDDNLEALYDLEQNLIALGQTLQHIPFVIQFNKWDVPNKYDLETLQQRINFYQVPYFKGIATRGVGVFETLKTIINLIIQHIQQVHQPVY
ncbi:MAG: GTPase domain-containing protein [candidate division KSB1 bacterium]|nr:GTPase domain-containing protein [candidate division KSB1 bacterium]MDZ7335096.1 GTPase domain-containing protein [candidate division KSB1 bacterium]MDZ7356235.1 GTPase domain-containing protein [candidate division KSB1 bacterium]MDZ7400040.1 GTPase domain-containing protein [candidate division KSB1 bacterium]